MTEKQYYSYLDDALYKKNAHRYASCNEFASKLTIVCPSTGKYEELLGMLKAIENNYGFNMKLNYSQLYLWQKNFCPHLDDDAILGAGIFVIFCCLVDNFLDSNRFSTEQKEKVAQKITYFEQRSIEKYCSRTNDYIELNLLSKSISDFINSNVIDNHYTKAELFKDMMSAFKSELFMYRNRLCLNESMSKSELSNYTDKSVMFEKVAFLMVSYGYNTEKSIEVAECLGKIFWLIDDLCDFLIDIRAKRRNSLLVYCVNETKAMDLSERVDKVFDNIDIAINELEKQIEFLRLNVDISFYSYMMSQIWKWGSHVRESH